MTTERGSPSRSRAWVTTVQTALFAAAFSFLSEFLLLAYLHSLQIDEALFGEWAAWLRPAIYLPVRVSPIAAALAGTLLGRRLPAPGAVERWLVIALVARGSALLLGAASLSLLGGRGSLASLASAALVVTLLAVLYVEPMMWGVLARSIVSRRRARLSMGAAFGALAVCAVGILTWFAASAFRAGLTSVYGLSVSPSGRVYAATQSGLFAADPGAAALRHLHCGRWGTPTQTVVADARDPDLVWAGLQVPGGLSTNMVESRDAGRSWHPIPGLPSPNTLVSTPSAIYAMDTSETLWVNPTGAPGGWEKRPLDLPPPRASGRVRIFPGALAASPQRPGLALLSATCEVTASDFEAVTWQGALYRTTDYGRTWELLRLPLAEEQGSTEQIDDVTLIAGRPERVAVATWWGGLLISPDQGISWRRLKRPQGERPRVIGAPTDPPSMYLLTEGRVYLSRDLAQTWHRIPNPAGSSAEGGVSCLAVSPADPHTIYVGAWQNPSPEATHSASGGVYRSLDEGSIWRRLPYSYPRLGRGPD